MHAGGCRRVLLIEDHADSGEGTELWLRLSGHTVKLARTGSDGIERARQFHPDVVLCDIGLEGGMDGYGVARALRADPDTASAYLVAVTGYGRPEDIQRSREAGFDLHLTKPVDPRALEATIRELR
jgi:CheY-like chemotaxis protein